ncbi:hypothetical protein RB195_006278 [Necator americanus]|uniref:HAT C-terminal dimerisation domain-containing protein n=1 Tax=Necator americanus TaxID=51031 RepID=A0ABR1BRU8_NECAM
MLYLSPEKHNYTTIHLISQIYGHVLRRRNVLYEREKNSTIQRKSINNIFAIVSHHIGPPNWEVSDPFLNAARMALGVSDRPSNVIELDKAFSSTKFLKESTIKDTRKGHTKPERYTLLRPTISSRCLRQQAEHVFGMEKSKEEKVRQLVLTVPCSHRSNRLSWWER